MTDFSFEAMAELFAKADAAVKAQASAQPEIDRLNNTLSDKLDYIARLEADVMALKRTNDVILNDFNDQQAEISNLRKERDDHGLEAMALRDELDTFKANVDRALASATETFYTTMQSKPPSAKPVDHVHEPVIEGPVPTPPSFNEPEPSYGDVMAWSAWNKRRVDFNNSTATGPIIISANTDRNFSY